MTENYFTTNRITKLEQIAQPLVVRFFCGTAERRKLAFVRLNGKSRLFCNLLLPAQSRRSKPLGLACAACFEQLACVFASCGALHYAKILASLKIKNGISLTPLNCDLNAFTFALKDSADAFVERLSK